MWGEWVGHDWPLKGLQIKRPKYLQLTGRLWTLSYVKSGSRHVIKRRRRSPLVSFDLSWGIKTFNDQHNQQKYSEGEHIGPGVIQVWFLNWKWLVICRIPMPSGTHIISSNWTHPTLWFYLNRDQSKQKISSNRGLTIPIVWHVNTLLPYMDNGHYLNIKRWCM